MEEKFTLRMDEIPYHIRDQIKEIRVQTLDLRERLERYGSDCQIIEIIGENGEEFHAMIGKTIYQDNIEKK